MIVADLVRKLQKLDPDRIVIGFDANNNVSDVLEIKCVSVCTIDGKIEYDGTRGCIPMMQLSFIEMQR